MLSQFVTRDIYTSTVRKQPILPKSATFPHFPFANCVRLLWNFITYSRAWHHKLNEDGSITSTRKQVL